MMSCGTAGTKFAGSFCKEKRNFSFSVCCITIKFKPIVIRADLQGHVINELSDTMDIL